MPLSKICQDLDRIRRESLFAKSIPRSRSASVIAIPSLKSGTIFIRETRWTNSAKSEIIMAGSAPASYWLCISFNASFALPCIMCSNKSMILARSDKPIIWRTLSASIWLVPCEIAWSSNESESRAEPSPALAIMANASSEISMDSASDIWRMSCTNNSASIRRRSNR